MYESFNLIFLTKNMVPRVYFSNQLVILIKMDTRILTDRIDNWRIDVAEHEKSFNCSFIQPLSL